MLDGDGDTWGWSGSVREFLSEPLEAWARSVADHHLRLLRCAPSASQTAAWTDSYNVLADALRECVAVDSDVMGWGVVSEYELPLEGGRRPDFVVLAGSAVIVIECKTAPLVRAADVDQVRAYARDLADYHAESHGRTVVPILLLLGAKGFAAMRDDVIVSGPESLHEYLYRSALPGSIDLGTWLRSDYRPLPTLVAAAKRIFNHEPLPHVRRALAAGIPETVERLVQLCDEAEKTGGRTIAFVTGVPGSGKTLVGLRLVYERSTSEGRATFLSGNGPLVEVLKHALKSGVFVKDLHKIVLSYGRQGRLPREHILVFDEAQRAWDVEQVLRKHGIEKSEPDLLVNIGERVEGWSVLVGLVGEGQEIHTGEEGGLEQWASAVKPPNASAPWTVWCAPKLTSTFPDHDVQTDERLDLTVSLRSRRAEVLHAWVSDLLAGELASAARRAVAIQGEGFTMYLTRDLDEAREYARWRYSGEPDARYGLLASSHAKIVRKYGVPNDFMTTNKFMRFGPWYNDPPDSPYSCCAMTTPATEFGCQGLELDLPIVCWGEDHRWTGTDWQLTPIRRQVKQHDPEQLLTNAYRVLLTRGRDGFVVFLPAEDKLDSTEHALLAAGVRPLPTAVDLPAVRVAGGAA